MNTCVLVRLASMGSCGHSGNNSSIRLTILHFVLLFFWIRRGLSYFYVLNKLLHFLDYCNYRNDHNNTNISFTVSLYIY